MSINASVKVRSVLDRYPEAENVFAMYEINITNKTEKLSIEGICDHFNVDMEEADRPAWKARFFIGVPSPSAGGLVMLPIYLQAAEIIDLSEYPSLILANTIIVGLLMVSTLPTFSGKGLTHIRRDLVLPLMLFIGSMAVMLFTFPWLTLTAMSIFYYTVLPFSAFAYWSYKQG